MAALSMPFALLLALIMRAAVLAPAQYAQQPAGFLSIDIGSAQAQSYTDPKTGIVWTPDALLWPELEGWSTAVAVGPPAPDFADQKQFQSFRYFGQGGAGLPAAPPKFCYPLPARPGSYYLIRASFWCGSSLPPTRASGLSTFRVIIDSYVGPQLSFRIPMTGGIVEEYYVRALDGSSSVAFCVSSGSSDVPFLNSLELRPLPNDVMAIQVLDESKSALRVRIRYDLGAPSGVDPIIRYPNDTADRFWFTRVDSPTNVTSEKIDPSASYDAVPTEVMQTNVMAATIAGLVYNFSLPGSHDYFINLLMIELDPQVKAGARLIDVTLNRILSKENVDIFNGSGGLNQPYQVFTPTAFGPYVDHVAIALTPSPTSAFLPSLAALEVMQVFDNPMVVPTSSNDASNIQGVTTTLSNLSIFMGDPCLPVDYQYPWIGCNADLSPPRVTSISLSNYNLVGPFPKNISNLDRLDKILLDGNSLEGPLPDLSKLLYLEVLNLSNNKLNGSIPSSLGTLPKLVSLDLTNNNFSGVIPTSLQLKKGLVFKYDGNQFLCLASSGSCSSNSSSTPPTPSQSSSKENQTPLVIGVVSGVVVVVVLAVIAIICVCFCKEHKSGQQTSSNQNNGNTKLTPNSAYEDNVVSHSRIIEAANVAQEFTYEEIVTATNNFTTILGKGGFGVVYEGILTNGVVVAVKLLSNASHQGAQEFLNEVSLLSRVRHKNLVELVGYCIENNLVLVYEFMSEGSLFDALFGKKRTTILNWRERLQILLDAAQGLAYLHTGCNSLIIHRDVKSSNILITKKLEGKMSDFGISRLQSSKGNDHSTTKLVGSMGYLDPEYAATLRLTEKVDVYSFGVVLFEAMCGQQPLIRNTTTGDMNIHISQWIKPHYEQGSIERAVDKRLGNDYNVSSMWKVAELAMACVQYEGSMRPTMTEVCDELKEALKLESIPLHGISPSETGEFVSATEVQAR